MDASFVIRQSTRIGKQAFIFCASTARHGLLTYAFVPLCPLGLGNPFATYEVLYPAYMYLYFGCSRLLNRTPTSYTTQPTQPNLRLCVSVRLMQPLSDNHNHIGMHGQLNYWDKVVTRFWVKAGKISAILTVRCEICLDRIKYESLVAMSYYRLIHEETRWLGCYVYRHLSQNNNHHSTGFP